MGRAVELNVPPYCTPVELKPRCDCGAVQGFFDSRTQRAFCAFCGRIQMPPGKRAEIEARNRAMAADSAALARRRVTMPERARPRAAPPPDV